MIAVLAVGALKPDIFHHLMREDAWAEWCTFFAFIAAAGFAAYGALGSGRSRPERFVFIGLGLFCFFVAGEEVSWGQRLLGFTAPEVFLRENYQQEFELHNILRVLSDSDIARSRWQVVSVAALYGLASLGALVGWIPRLFAPHISLLPWLLACAALNILYPFHRTGEMAEMLLGLVFATDLAMRLHGRARLNGARNATLALCGILFAGATLPFALENLVYRANPRDIATARGELGLIADDLRRPGTLHGKAFAAQRFHKRIFTAVKQGYFDFENTSSFLEHQLSPAEAPEGRGRTDRRGYFVDPWGQSYWIAHEYRPGDTWAAILYSAGPNRKRELRSLDLEKRFAQPGEVDTGDDLYVFINFAKEFPGGIRMEPEPSSRGSVAHLLKHPH